MAAVQHSEISYYVDSRHVTTSPRVMARALINKLRSKKAQRASRRYIIAAVFNRWARNMWEYKYVMGSVPRSYPSYVARYLWDDNKKEVVIREP